MPDGTHVDLTLLRRPLFVVATGGALVSGVAVIGVMTFLPNVLQLAHGISPLGTALLFGLWSGASFVVSLQARRVRLDSRAQLVLGLLLSAIGYLPLLGVGGHWSLASAVLGLLVSGVGSGFVNAALAHLAIESVPPTRSGMGAGANNTAATSAPPSASPRSRRWSAATDSARASTSPWSPASPSSPWPPSPACSSASADGPTSAVTRHIRRGGADEGRTSHRW